MDTLGQLYTAGTWTVKPGNEESFIRAWEAFAQWTAQHVEGAMEARLLQDLTHPERFLSFGPWGNSEQVQAWRATPEFTAFVAQVRELCESFQPGSYRLVVQILLNSETDSETGRRQKE